MTSNLLDISIVHPWTYVVFVFICPLVIRLLLALLSGTYECTKKIPRRRFTVSFREFFAGTKGGDPDYWSGYLVGVAELAIFPFLLAAGAWTVIGAWIAGKTAIGWRHWDDAELRVRFNHFLVATAAVLALSYVSALCSFE